jgi:uncharacterized protein YfiM (DUF2279 family)
MVYGLMVVGALGGVLAGVVVSLTRGDWETGASSTWPLFVGLVAGAAAGYGLYQVIN